MRAEVSMTYTPRGQPTRAQKWVDGATTAGAVHPGARITSATSARCSPSSANLLAVRAGFSTAMPASCSTYVLTSPQEGSSAGTCTVNTDPLRSTSFPCFDGTNPRLWRTQCLEYFNRFNIQKCMWVVAATLHMEGSAKVWYEAYRLRQAVGDWSEFMDNVESHFGVADFPPSAQILGSAYPSDNIHASEDISPRTTTGCLNESPKEVMDKAAEPKELTFTQLTERIKLQLAQLKLALAAENEERKKKHLMTITQMTVPIADSSEEVLTHVNGVSLFLEPWLEPAGTVFSDITLIELADEAFTCVGGSSLFLKLDIDSANKAFEDEVLITVGGVSLFLEQVVNSTYHENTFSYGMVEVSAEGTVFELSPSSRCDDFSPGVTNAKSEYLPYCSSREHLSIHWDLHGLQPVRWSTSHCKLELTLGNLLWDPGGSRFACWVLDNKHFGTNIVVYFMNLLPQLYVSENGKSAVLAMELYVKWDPGIQLGRCRGLPQYFRVHMMASIGVGTCAALQLTHGDNVTMLHLGWNLHQITYCLTTC